MFLAGVFYLVAGIFAVTGVVQIVHPPKNTSTQYQAPLDRDQLRQDAAKDIQQEMRN